MSSGLNVAAAVKVAQNMPENSKIVTILCDGGQVYYVPKFELGLRSGLGLGLGLDLGLRLGLGLHLGLGVELENMAKNSKMVTLLCDGGQVNYVPKFELGERSGLGSIIVCIFCEEGQVNYVNLVGLRCILVNSFLKK